MPGRFVKSVNAARASRELQRIIILFTLYVFVYRVSAHKDIYIYIRMVIKMTRRNVAVEDDL